MQSFQQLTNAIYNAWLQYGIKLGEYMAIYSEGMNDFQTNHELYNRWCELSQMWGVYTAALRDFQNFTNWSQSIPVNYGEPVGFSSADNKIVFMNAFTGQDDETALCRHGDGNQLFMRVGGLPNGTFIYTSMGIYEVAGGAPVPRPMDHMPVNQVA